jgi:hypothetical protein
MGLPVDFTVHPSRFFITLENTLREKGCYEAEQGFSCPVGDSPP